MRYIFMLWNGRTHTELMTSSLGTERDWCGVWGGGGKERGSLVFTLYASVLLILGGGISLILWFFKLNASWGRTLWWVLLGTGPVLKNPTTDSFFPPATTPALHNKANAIFMNRNSVREDSASKKISAEKTIRIIVLVIPTSLSGAVAQSAAGLAGPKRCNMLPAASAAVSLLSVCWNSHLAPETPRAFGMLPWHLATDTFMAEGGGISIPTSFIPCQRSVVFQNSKFFLPREWQSIWGWPHRLMSVAFIRENLPPDPLPPPGYQPSWPEGLWSAFLPPKVPVAPLQGPSLPALEEAFL